MMTRKNILILLLLSLFGPMMAQNVKETSSCTGIFIEPSLRYGSFVPFASRHHYIKESSLYGLDLRVGRQTDGSKAWEELFSYPSYGLLFRYEHNTLDSAKYEHRDQAGQAVTDWVPIGDCFTVAGFLDGHLYNGKTCSLDYGFTFGLSFWPKYGNEFIGSPIDAHLAFQLGPTLHASDQLDLFARAMFSHSSDGALKLPNYGTNVLSGSIGVRYYMENRPSVQFREPEIWCPTWAFYASNAFGMLQTNTRLHGHLPSEMPYYSADYIQMGFTHHFHPKFRYNVGLEVGYTGETKVKYDQAYLRAIGDPNEEETLETSLEDYSFPKSTHVATSCSFEVMYNKLAISLGLGYYLYHGIYLGTDEHKTWGVTENSMTAFERQYLPDDYRNLFERLGIKYYFGKNNRFYVGMFVKAHSSVDYIEWTLGTHLFQQKGKERMLFRDNN